MSIFPAKIILATDGSEDAELALQTAADIAMSTNSELNVITVGPGNPDPVYWLHQANLNYDTYEEAVEAVQQEAQEVLDGQVRKIEEAGGTVKRSLLSMEERRDQAILNFADEIEAGLIVMGSRGHGGLRRALMGSVSDSVVRHAHCPVLIVRK
jgi:nucleotide-binding universal stress UspA family protein